MLDSDEFLSEPCPSLLTQMQPSSFPNDVLGDVGSKSSYSGEVRSDIECPTGSVPILRSNQSFRSTMPLGALMGSGPDYDPNSTIRVSLNDFLGYQ